MTPAALADRRIGQRPQPLSPPTLPPPPAQLRSEDLRLFGKRLDLVIFVVGVVAMVAVMEAAEIFQCRPATERP